MDTAKNGEDRANWFGNSILRITHVEANGVHILTAFGAIDLATVQFLDDAVAAVVRAAPRRLIIDLSDVDFFGTTGFLALLNAKKGLGPDGQFAVVACAGRISARPLKLINAGRDLSIFESLHDALTDGVAHA